MAGLTNLQQSEMTGFYPTIVEDILSRLHSKTLLRLSIVSKKWKSLISTSYFQRLHQEKSSKRPNLLLLSAYSYVGFVLTTLSLTGDELDQWNIPLDSARKVDMIASPCGLNNLVCLVVDLNRFVLCIPSVKKIIHIPQLPYSYFDKLSVYGFCYLPDGNRHVIVCLNDNNGWQIITYSNDGSHLVPWKPVAGGIEIVLIGTPGGTFANGVLYWIGFGPGSDLSLLCFDLYKEKFYTVAFSEQMRGVSTFFLVELKGDLHLMTVVRGGELPFRMKSYTLWKLDAADQTWMKVHTIDNTPWCLGGLVGCHDGAMLFRDGHFLVWFSPENEVGIRDRRLVHFQYPVMDLKLHTDILSSSYGQVYDRVKLQTL